MKTQHNTCQPSESVAIIVLNWNNENDSIDCLRSLEKITYPNFKVFMVDNGSCEASAAAVRAFCKGRVVFIETGKNLGFSGGNNVGIRRALEEGFAYVLLLNSDTTVALDFLDEMAAVARSDENIGVVGPKIYFSFEPNRIWYGGGKFTWLEGSSHVHYETTDKNPHEKYPHETDYMTGCCFLIKTSVIRKIGMLYDDFFLYYEDVDWSLRARKAGYKILYVPSSKIYHKVTRSIAKIGNPKIHYYHTRNVLLLARRHARFFALAGMYAWSIFHYAKQLVKIFFFPAKREMAKMIMKGITDFYRGKFGQIT